MQEFIWPVRVYYEDTDSGGVVYYANYLKFMERARTEWLRSLKLEQDTLAREHKVLFVVRSVSIDYRRPARFNDLLQVRSRLEEVRGASLVFGQEIVKTANSDKLLCHGRIMVACVNADTFKPRSVPRMILMEIFGDS